MSGIFVDPEYKQVIILRTDLKMGKGKLVAQGAHAAVNAAQVSEANHYEVLLRWLRGGYKKVVLKVSSEEELLDYFLKGLDAGLPTIIVRDAGLTQLAPETPTAVAIGPGSAKKIDEITQGLKLL